MDINNDMNNLNRSSLNRFSNSWDGTYRREVSLQIIYKRIDNTEPVKLLPIHKFHCNKNVLHRMKLVAFASRCHAIEQYFWLFLYIIQTLDIHEIIWLNLKRQKWLYYKIWSDSKTRCILPSDHGSNKIIITKGFKC